MTMESLIPVAASFAGDIDNLIIWITIVVGLWFVLAEALLLGFILKFRRREGHGAQYISGDEKAQHLWILVPLCLVLVCDLVILFGENRIWVHVKEDLPPHPDATVRIIGQQWVWSFVHPGIDGRLDTADDIKTVDELHVEVGKTYVYELEARDVLHSFSIPVFRLKQDAIPGRVIKGWFQPTRTGTFDLQCAEICGVGHGIMAARIWIETPEEHAAWMGAPAALQLAAAR